jgi:hypothetical protein
MKILSGAYTPRDDHFRPKLDWPNPPVFLEKIAITPTFLTLSQPGPE